MREDLATALLWSPGFLFGLVALVGAVLLLLLLRFLRRARDAASYAELDRDEPPSGDELGAAGDAEPLRVVDLRGSPRRTDLRRTFRRVTGLTERPGAGVSGRLPWFLCLGAAGAGKSTLLGHSDLRLPYGEPRPGAPGEPPPPCRLWIFDRAVVVDVDGDLVLPAGGVASERNEWLALLRALHARHRGRSADGVVLTVAADELAAAADGDATAQRLLGRRADRMRRRLEQAQRAFGLRLPVSLVVTRSDLLPGMPELLRTLDARQRRQIFGWSNPHPADAPYAGAWVDDAVDGTAATLRRHQLRLLAEDGLPEDADRRAFLALPATVAALAAPLHTWVNRIFAGGPSAEAPPLRGIYLTAGQGFDAPPADSLHELAGTVAPPAEGGHRRVAFVTDLLSEKVFADWDLARPDDDLAAERRHLAALARAAAVLLLVLGVLGLAWSGWWAVRRAQQLQDGFVQPAQRALDCRGADCRQPTTDALLDGADQVPDYRLRFAFLPPSWASPLARDVPRLGSRAYEESVFPTLHRRLAVKRQAVLAPPAEPAREPPLSAAACPLVAPAAAPTPARPPDPIYDLPTAPAYSDLRGWLGDVTALQDHLVTYGRFVGTGTCLVDEATTLRLFGDLTDYAFDRRPRPPTRDARDFYGQILCDVRPAGLADLSAAGSVVDQRLDSRFTTLLWQLFHDNVVSRGLADTAACIDYLARTPMSEAEAAVFYGHLVDLIDRTRRDLSRPRVQWIGQSDLELGAPYRALLGDVATLPVAAKDSVQRLNRRADQAFADYRWRLGQLATGPTGPLLASEGDGPLLRLSPNVLGLRTALATLVDTYLGPADDAGWEIAPPAGTWLDWDAARLSDAADHLEGYDSFVPGEFGAYPGMRRVVEGATRAKVERDVLEMAALGQRFPPLPRLAGAEALESHLADQVDGLSAAAGPLNRLLTAFSKPAGRAGCEAQPELPWCRVARTTALQQAALMSELDRLLDALQLYSPTPAGLDAWNGDGNLAWLAFGVPDAPGLAAYVASQRAAVTRLDDAYATPVLTAVPLPDGAFRGPTHPAVERWQLIRGDLQGYTAGTPDNPVARLESFINATMSAATPANCLDVEPRDTACLPRAQQATSGIEPPPCDLFHVARSRLVLATAARCESVLLRRGDDAWSAVRGSFDDRLRGRYPFAPPVIEGVSLERPAPDATPAEVAEFFAVYDAGRPHLERLFAVYARRHRDPPPGAVPQPVPEPGPDAPWPGQPSWPALPWSRASESRVREFTARTDAVRDFFASFLAARTEAAAKGGDTPLPLPEFALGLDLRPRPRAERGSGAVIRRSLWLDGSPVRTLGPAPATAEPPLTWTWGAPLRLTLEWAKDGPHLPRAPEDGSAPTAVARVAGHTLVYDFRAPWSLIRLLQMPRQQGLLAFTSPTAAAPVEEDPCRQATPCGVGGSLPPVPSPQPVTLLVEVVPHSPDETARPLSLPRFPFEAPAVLPPGSSGQRTASLPAGGG